MLHGHGAARLLNRGSLLNCVARIRPSLVCFKRHGLLVHDAYNLCTCPSTREWLRAGVSDYADDLQHPLLQFVSDKTAVGSCDTRQ